MIFYGGGGGGVLELWESENAPLLIGLLHKWIGIWQIFKAFYIKCDWWWTLTFDIKSYRHRNWFLCFFCFFWWEEVRQCLLFTEIQILRGFFSEPPFLFQSTCVIETQIYVNCFLPVWYYVFCAYYNKLTKVRFFKNHN